MTASATAASDLITEDWRIHGSVYTSPEIFGLEQRRLFHAEWLYVAHETEVAHPGDYKTTFAGTQPVIVARGADDNRVRVLLNRCRHRGSAVCRDEAGNANYFRCPYHGWTYRNSGELRGITYDEGYVNLDRASLGLVAAPRVDSYAGFIFASFAPEGPTLEDYLGHARPYLEIVADQGADGIRLTAGSHRLQYGANWKLQVENTIDNYHFGFVHRSFLEVLADRIGQPPPIVHNILTNPEWRTIDLGGGHSVHEFGDPRTGNNQGQLGDLPFNLIIFPNLCFVGAQLRHVLPKAADRTEVRLYPILHEGESDEDNAGILRAHESFYGPSGMGGTDDIEVAFDRVGDGLKAVEHNWIIMSRGAHREQLQADGTLVGHAADEVPQRAFYRRWKALMEEEE
jgi:nitrite reductase/ring-hydroxylating ferredoxin subunit